MTLLVAGCSKPEEVISRQVTLANQNLEQGNTDQAVEILQKLDRKYPGQPAVLEALGFAFARTGRHDAAAASFVAAADIDPASSSLRQLAGEAYLNDGEPGKAAAQLRLYLAEFPGDFQAWQKLGQIEEDLGNVARAIDAYLEWYRIRPSGEASYRLGAAFRKLNNSPQAKAWYEATIKHGEFRVEEALLGLLELEVEAGDMASAEQTVGQIDKNFPDALDASPLAGVRNRLAAWKESQEAIAAARAEQERLAKELEAMRLRQEQQREAAARQQEAAEAQAATPSQSAVETPPIEKPPQPSRNTPIATLLPSSTPNRSELPADLRSAIERREGGDTEGAIEMLWRALGSEDDRVDLWVELADAYRSLGQYSAAEACILEARRRSQDSIEVETAYLNIVRESQPREVYLSRVEAAREKFPANANLAYVFARELAEAEGDTVRTIAAYEDFLLLADPADPRREDAAAFLARARR